MAVTYTDTLTGSNGTLLNVHVADTGQTYTAPADLTIQSNALESSNAGTVLGNVDQVQAYTTDYVVSYDAKIASGATAKHGMTACHSGSDILYWTRFDPTINEIQLYRTLTGNISTKLGSWDYGAWVGPIVINIKLYVEPTQLRVEVDGTERIVSSDTSITRTGDIGVRMFGTTGAAIDNLEFESDPVAPGTPIITDIDSDDDVYDGQVTTLTGTSLGATGGTLKADDVSQVVASNTATSASITIVQDHLNYGLHNFVWTDTLAVSSAAFPVTISPVAGLQFITAASPVSDNTSLFFGVSPAVVNGDQLETPLLTDQGKSIALAIDGTFIITGAGSVKQTFTYRIHDLSDDSWSNYGAVIVNGTLVSIGLSRNTAALNFFISSTGTATRDFNTAAITYYKSVTTTNSSQFNELLKAAQQAENFVGLWPGDRGN